VRYNAGDYRVVVGVSVEGGAFMTWTKPTFKVVAATFEVTAYMGKR